MSARDRDCRITGTAGQWLTVLALSMAAVACGEFLRQGQSPSQVVVESLQAAAGVTPGEFRGTLNSDVQTVVARAVEGQQVATPTTIGDLGQIVMSLMLRDPGQPGVPSAPSAVNQVTFTRYRVVYRRADGRNAPGVDVPYPFDGAATFTVPATGSVTAGFEIVRRTAKVEAPLAALAGTSVVITTIAHIAFYGRDQTGHEVRADGAILINFGDFDEQ